MAIPAAAVWEVRPTVGSDTNGGGFVTGGSGTDFSQQDAANSGASNKSTTDAVGIGTTTVTSATANFTSAIVGNIIYLDGGWYEVVTFTNSTTIVVDRSTPTGTGLAMNIGGALAHWVTALAASVSGNTIWVKGTGSDVMTSNGVGSSGQSNIWVIGYTSTRGDGGQATITTATNGVIPFQFSGGSGAQWLLMNLLITCTAGSPGDGIKANLASSTQSGLTVVNCRITGFGVGLNASNEGFNAGIAGLLVISCEIDTCTSHGCSVSECAAHFEACYFHGNGGNGFYVADQFNQTGEILINRCVMYANTLSGMRSAAAGGVGRELRILNSAFVSNTLDGIRMDGGNAAMQPFVANAILYGNAGFGLNVTTALTSAVLSYNNAYGDNSSGASTGWVTETSPVTLSANPFTNPSTGDFSLNSTSGGGTACKQAGFPTMIGA